MSVDDFVGTKIVENGVPKIIQQVSDIMDTGFKKLLRRPLSA